MPDVTRGSVLEFADAPTIIAHPVSLRGARRRWLDVPGVVALTVLVLVAAVALLAPLVAPFDPTVPMDISARATPPSATHLFGTDHLTRDVLSRVIFGARLSLGIAFGAVLLALVTGVAWGALAGYAGGALDGILMRIVDAGLAIPRIILLLAVAAFWGRMSAPLLAAVLGFTGWFGTSRLVRAEVRGVRSRDFVTAARALGATGHRILVRHVIPHTLAPVLVAATLAVGQVIVVEAGLSFLGYGIAPPAASWGSIIRDGWDHIATAWWMSVFPGAVLATTVLAIHVVGDRLRIALGANQLPRP